MKNPFKKKANFASYAKMLVALKKFEDKGLIHYNFKEKKAFINEVVFKPLLEMTGLNYEKLCKAAAVKIYLENNLGKKKIDPSVVIDCNLFDSKGQSLAYQIIK